MRHNLLLAFGLVLSMPIHSWAQPPQDLSGAYRRIHEATNTNPLLPYSPNSVLVRFKPGTNENEKTAQIRAVGATSLHRFRFVQGLELLEVPSGAFKAISALRASGRVRYAVQNRLIKQTTVPNDPNFGLQWGLFNSSGYNTNAPQAWGTTTGNQDFVVAIVDSGMQLDHPELAPNLWTNPDEIAANGLDDDNNGYVDDVYGWDWVNYDNDPTDVDGHGTHVAGIVGARGNNGIGVSGINWQCKMMALKAFQGGTGLVSDIMLAFEYMLDKGVKVSNNSYGGYETDQAWNDAIAAVVASNHLMAAGAGNDSLDTDIYPFYPASSPGVIGVVAADQAGFRAGFSNYGYSMDILAPGDNILSTYLGSSTLYLSGTSMATPHVAGTLALIWGQDPSLSPSAVYSRLLISASYNPAFDGVVGGGAFLNIGAAPFHLNPTVTISSPTDNASYATGASVSFVGSAYDEQDGTVTPSLVWTSSLDGQIGTGGSFSKSNLSIGTHTITATATDSTSRTGSQSITLNITQAPPNAPSNVTASKQSSGVARINWTDNSSNETGFEVQRETKVGSSWTNQTLVGSVGANTTQFVNNAGAGTFRYRVRSYNAQSASAWSAWSGQVKL